MFPVSTLEKKERLVGIIILIFYMCIIGFCTLFFLILQESSPFTIKCLRLRQKLRCRWLDRAMVLGSFQCRGVLLLWHMVGQGPAVLAAGMGRVGCFYIFSSRLSYFPFLMPQLLGDGWSFWNIVVSSVITQQCNRRRAI